MTEPKEQSQQAYFGSGAPLQTTGYIQTQPSVCPTCGTCPTCGHKPNITPPWSPYVGPFWPNYPTSPQRIYTGNPTVVGPETK